MQKGPISKGARKKAARGDGLYAATLKPAAKETAPAAAPSPALAAEKSLPMSPTHVANPFSVLASSPDGESAAEPSPAAQEVSVVQKVVFTPIARRTRAAAKMMEQVVAAVVEAASPALALLASPMVAIRRAAMRPKLAEKKPAV
jgi:hypothetical protein